AEWALQYLGETELQLENYAAARDAYEDGLKRFERGRLAEEMRFGLARALEGLQDVDKAASLYEQIAGGGGRRAADAQFNLAARQFEAENYQQAAELFESLVRNHPE